LTIWGFITGIEPWFGSPFGLYFGFLTASIAGIIAGDPVTGVVTASTLFFAFLGVVSLGGAAVPEQRTAAVVIPPLVIATQLDPISAVPLAWAIAMLGSYFYTAAMTVNVYFCHLADKYAEEENYRGVELANLLGLIPHGLSVAIPVFLFSMYGPEFVNTLVERMPEWFWTGLKAAGGVMVTVGVALLLSALWRREFLPIYLLGFSLATYLNVPLIGIAVIGIGLIGAAYLLSGRAEKLLSALKELKPVEERERKLTDADIRKCFWRSWCLQNNLNWERLEGIGYCFSILPALKKLFKGDELKERVKAHLEFYNTTPYTHNIIMGLDLALEERGADIELIRSIKSGLMGPLAGIGDTIFWFTLVPIIGGIAASIAKGGHVWSIGVYILLWVAIMWSLKWWFTKTSYKYGLSIAELFTGPAMEEISLLMTAFGMLMLGGITAAYIPIYSPLKYEPWGFELQKILDMIIPKFLPLIFVFFNTSLIRKGWSVIKVVTLLFIIGFVLGIVGIIGA